MNELIYVFISLVSRLNGTLVKSEFKNSTLNIILNLYNLKSASNLNDNLNCSKELEHYAS